MSTVETTRADLPPAGPPRRRWPQGYVIAAIVLGLLVLGLVVAIARAGDRPAGQHTLSAPVGGRHSARLEIVNGVGHISVHSADIGNDLYRISTPDGSGQRPTVTESDEAFLLGFTAAGSGDGIPSTVDIVVNPAVTWQFRLAGGADEARLDLRGTTVSGVDVASGTSTVELWLPRPHDTVVVRETGGANEFVLHAPAAIPVRLAVTGGAGSAVIDGVDHTGVGGGQVFTPADWVSATDRYDVDAVGGVSQVRIDRY